jgi:hypothetical protein
MKGDVIHASKVTGIIQKEVNRKQWRQINKSTCKAQGGLAVAVKIPMADGGHIKYKTKDGVFEAVSPIIQEWFQLTLVEQCHQGTFFEDVSHLAYGPAAQQILDRTYKYPPDLDQATRLLFEEVAAAFAALSPSKNATYITPEDFTQF